MKRKACAYCTTKTTTSQKWYSLKGGRMAGRPVLLTIPLNKLKCETVCKSHYRENQKLLKVFIIKNQIRVVLYNNLIKIMYHMLS